MNSLDLDEIVDLVLADVVHSVSDLGSLSDVLSEDGDLIGCKRLVNFPL